MSNKHWSDLCLDEKLDCLNAFYGEGFGWRHITARTAHLDNLGDNIKRGEVYFKIDLGGFGTDHHPKLSLRSMEKLLALTLQDNRFGQRLGARIAAEREKQFTESVLQGLDNGSEGGAESPSTDERREP